MSSEISKAIRQICDEKNIPLESVIKTIEAAMAVAYRKEYGDKNQNIIIDFDIETGKYRVFDQKTVVEKGPEPEPEIDGEALTAETVQQKPAAKPDAVAPDLETEEEKEKRFNPKTDITLEEAQKIDSKYEIGDVITTELPFHEEFGRMAAQTAKQVIIQKLREAEREILFTEYQEKIGHIINGTVQRIEGKVVLVDLGHAIAVMPPREQVRGEFYKPSERIKVLLLAVEKTNKGPEIIASRSHPDMVRELFESEVPEIASGAIEIKSISREAGSRSKIAVATTQENIDPIGSCVGQRGTRVQTVISELGGEKIDIVEWSEDPVRFIINALSPAKVISVKLNEEHKAAVAEVKEDQLSLAIGKTGQNVRLAAQLTGWRIDVVKESDTPVVNQNATENLQGQDFDEAAAEADNTTNEQ